MMSNATTAAHAPEPTTIGPRLNPLSPKAVMTPAAMSGRSTGASSTKEGIKPYQQAVGSLPTDLRRPSGRIALLPPALLTTRMDEYVCCGARRRLALQPPGHRI